MTAPGATAKPYQATLLCVDDEVNVLSSLKRLFRKDGHRVLTATGGAEGLQILQAEKVDVVISDMRMPEMDGAAFLKRVAKKWPAVMRILLTGYADMESTVAAVNEAGIFQYVSKPWNDDDLRGRVKQAIKMRLLERDKSRLEVMIIRQNKQLREMNEQLKGDVKARTEELDQTMGMLERAMDGVKLHFADVVEVLVNMTGVRDRLFAEHARRVADLAVSVASHMELSDDDCLDIRYAGLLHDIGKIGLPQHLLFTNYQSLDPDERALANRHPMIAWETLQALEPLHDAARLIWAHHEHYDGKGYPDKLAINQIPLGARILAVANEYDAAQIGMLTPGAFTHEQALDMIRQQRNKKFDPEVVDAFLAVIDGARKLTLPVREAVFNANELQPGMVLERDLVASDGRLLLAKGGKISKGIIESVEEFEEEDGRPFHLFIAHESVH